jgi:superfamily II DNA or RNA helicase
MTIALRDYQLECLEAVLNESKAGISRQLVSLPTGAGKTVVMAAIAKTVNKKTLLLAHREELITQAVEKFRLFWPEVNIGVCMAERDEIHNQIVIGSVQSCSRPKRLERLKEQGFELMMIDEAHHSISDSYQNVIDSLGFKIDSKRLLVGVTATVRRGDKQGLDNTFQKITFSRSIATMIRAGYLSNVEGRKILTNLTLDRIRTQNGDFCIDDLSEAVNTSERNDFIVRKFKEYAADRKAIGFCVDVAHCQALAEAFRKEGIKAAAVWGDMEKEDRRQTLDDFKHGRLQVVTSCGILCEGYDETSVTCVLMCRPTKSQALYVQCVGRGLRLHPGKENCLVIDFTDKGHNLDSVLSLSSALCDIPQMNQQDEEQTPEEIDHTPKHLILDEKDERFDILGNARFCWVAIGNNEWSLLDDEKREIVMYPAESGYTATLYFPDGSSRQVVSSPLPFEYCSGVCEDFARRHLKIAFADMSAPWMNTVAQPTQGQRDYLEKQGAWRDGMNKAAASVEIRKLVALKNKQRRQLSDEPITDKQRYFLKSCGVETANMSKLQAMQAIAKLKQKAS